MRQQGGSSFFSNASKYPENLFKIPFPAKRN
jgi:hypothetical protein